MPSARTLLAKGLVTLQREFGEVVTLDAYPGRQFCGLIEQAVYGNDLGSGGFLPTQEATLYLPVPQFAGLGFRPWPGLRLTVSGREFVVTSIGSNPQRYALTLTVAHPKESDVPGPSYSALTETGAADLY